MKTIAVQQFCLHYDIPSSFIDSLSSFELIEVVEVKNAKHLQIEDLQRVEKYMRLHYDLKINVEALDVVEHLSSQICALQDELLELKKKVAFYR